MASLNILGLYVFVFNNCKYLLILFWQKKPTETETETHEALN